MIESNLSKKVTGNKNAGATKKVAKPRKFIDIDEKIPAMAKRGELVSAGVKAYEQKLC